MGPKPRSVTPPPTLPLEWTQAPEWIQTAQSKKKAQTARLSAGPFYAWVDTANGAQRATERRAPYSAAISSASPS